MQLLFSQESVVIAVYALKNEHNQVKGVGDIVGGYPYLSVMYILKRFVATAVICDCIKKNEKQTFIFFALPFFLEPVFLFFFFFDVFVQIFLL